MGVKPTQTTTHTLMKEINIYAPVQGNARAKKGEWVGRGLGGLVWGTFGIALKMYTRKIPNNNNNKKTSKGQNPSRDAATFKEV